MSLDYTYNSAFGGCMDAAYGKAIDSFLKDRGLNADRVQLAGGAVNIANGDMRGQAMLDDIALSVDKHHVPLVILTVHGKCGYCDGKDDKAFYVAKVLEAKMLVEKRVPGIEVQAYYISPEMIFEEVGDGQQEEQAA